MPNKVQMWKLVLGIAVVVCVQFAFVNYMSLRPYLDLAVGPVHLELPSVEPDLSWMIELDHAALPGERSQDVAALPDVSRARPVARSVRSVRTAPNRTGASGSSIRRTESPTSIRAFAGPPAAAPGDFKTVVIRYNRDAAIPDCDTYKVPEPKKRSYLARSGTVIKKPMDWIRSVGSQLY